jgi:hypothetical protein
VIIHYDPDRYRTEVKSHTCAFHEAQPGVPYAGCTCSASYGSVERPPEEVAVIKRAKRIAHEERILAEAAAIKARRKAERGQA